MSTIQTPASTLSDLVASRVLGWKPTDRVANGWGDGPFVWSTGDRSSPTFQGFDPLNDDDQTVRVLRHLMKHGWQVSVGNRKRPWCAYFYKNGPSTGRPRKLFVREAVEETFGLAVCVAALRAVDVPETTIDGARP